MEKQQVILVDTNDQPTGIMEKMEAHQKGLLHRAFSIFIFNEKGEMLLQQRAAGKYHSSGLWSNACCSHPYPGEDTVVAASRRLKQELGFETPMEKAFDFIYREEMDNDLIEHEFDHVFAGYYNGEVNFDPAEVMNISFKSVSEIQYSLRLEPQKFTAWFRIAFPKLQQWWNR